MVLSPKLGYLIQKYKKVKGVLSQLAPASVVQANFFAQMERDDLSFLPKSIGIRKPLRLKINRRC
ncbi:hypothetical protein AVDCRST_MAG94-5885 [uncultured Leptolyngbya sp.]|uniref:Uncharacterized protein n=1 Tax=uncultured Leptolyngbya sp. TaxID=332963 RepID=A0A6J4NYV9_9CYAN|nr:hypothetical protein AVDCRST_MAG94-5885 [uncultured Leptolyngbya sp.]